MVNSGPLWRGRDCLFFALSLLLAGCATAPKPKSAGAAPPSPEQKAIQQATDDFSAGREAALSGDFECAHTRFDEAIETLRPEHDRSAPSPEMLAFSFEIYEGILRYEALATPPEEVAADEEAPEPAVAPAEAPPATAEAISTAREAIASDSSGITYDIPIVVNDSVLKVLATFQGPLAEIIGRGLARSGRYVPMIQRIFREEGIPTDLAQVALIESSFLPRARSPKAAHGIWQFMPRTGRQYGLTSNTVVDERSDPEKATRAAAKYLAYLHELFDDWYLALAAYNAGEGKVLRAQERTGLADFWQLAASGALKAQTQNYVPSVIAATLIAKNPGHYGFEIVYEAPLEYEIVNLNRPVRLRDLAVAEGLSLEELERLNPELKTGVTPRQPEGYDLKVPVGLREVTIVAFAAAPTAPLPGPRRHVVRRGETLGSVAKRYRVSTARLADANGLTPKSKIARGEVLMIPGRETAKAAAKSPKKGAGTSTSTKTASAKPAPAKKDAATASRSYRVKGGDTLYGIAKRTGTTVDSLMSANSLESPEKIRPGDRLVIPPRSR